MSWPLEGKIPVQMRQNLVGSSYVLVSHKLIINSNSYR